MDILRWDGWELLDMFEYEISVELVYNVVKEF